MSEPPAEPSPERPAKASGKPRPDTSAKVPPPPIPSEAEIDSPDFRTLAFLFVIFVVSVASWGAGRFACNMHPPESHGAPKLSTERLITTPKDAAIEFIQRFRSMDYDGALEIATGPGVRDEVSKDKASCAAKANECARQREASAGRLTTAVLLARDGDQATVRATTTLKGATETYLVTLRQEGQLWKVVSKQAGS